MLCVHDHDRKLTLQLLNQVLAFPVAIGSEPEHGSSSNSTSGSPAIARRKQQPLLLPARQAERVLPSRRYFIHSAAPSNSARRTAV